MTRSLRPLVNAGFIDIGLGADHRRRGVSITDEGHAAITAAEPGWQAAQARVDTRLGAEDHARLFALLDKIETLADEQETDR